MIAKFLIQSFSFALLVVAIVSLAMRAEIEAGNGDIKLKIEIKESGEIK